MIKYQIYFGVFIASMILLTGFKKSADANSHVGVFPEPVKISISDAIVVQGDKGQKTVEAMVLLSKASTEPVTVKYNTKDGSAKAGVDYIATSGSLKFEPGEISKQIPVSIIGEVAADPDEGAATQRNIQFEIDLNNALEALIDKSAAIVTILKTMAPPSNIGESVYEVALIYTGWLSLYGGTVADCGVNPKGVVVLSGLLQGEEKVGPRDDDDILYTGTLQMIMGIDVCSVTRLSNGEDKLCVLRVAGSGIVEAELKLYFGTDPTGEKFEGRGGYIKIENKDGRFMRTVTGECDAEQIDEEWTMIPNKSIASVFNGYELPMLVSRTLQKGIYSVTDPQGNTTTVNVVRKIR